MKIINWLLIIWHRNILHKEFYGLIPRDLKKKWVEALRSGKYKQGILHLTYLGKYCCLGVLGKVCGLSDEAMNGKKTFLGLDYFTEIPEVIRSLGRPSLSGKLINMNDANGKSFNEIADWIESNL